MNDIFTHYLNLPPAVKGLVVPTPEGDYQIFINARYNYTQCVEIFNHEMRHLLLGHHQMAHLPLARLEEQAALKDLLLHRIQQAAQKGLPLETALFQKEAPPLPPVCPAPQTAQTPVPIPSHLQKRLLQARRARYTGLHY